jgi:hypothetical protein
MALYLYKVDTSMKANEFAFGTSESFSHESVHGDIHYVTAI